jgi:hypothetical protein
MIFFYFDREIFPLIEILLSIYFNIMIYNLIDIISNKKYFFQALADPFRSCMIKNDKFYNLWLHFEIK